MSGEPSHFEVGVADDERARAFYGGLFGWSIDEIGWIDTGGVRGGLHGDDPNPGIVVYFAVDDIDAAVQKVRELGGVADDAEAEKPGERGRYTSCRDDQGVAFGLHEPERMPT